MKHLACLLTFVLLCACNNSQTYRITGALSNLDGDTLFAVYESPDGNRVDTVVCDERGRFTVVGEQSDNLHAVTFYSGDRRQWFSVYPEAGNPVRIKGDADCFQLLQINGGRTNDKLSEFRKKAAGLIKEKAGLDNAGESSNLLQRATLDHTLRERAKDFILKNTGEEAAAILLSEYFMEMDKVETTEELLGRLSPELYDYPLVVELKAQVAKAKMSMTGAQAPDFNVTDVCGVTFTPDSLADKYYILAFTAVWCDLCRTDRMMLDEIATQYPKDSLEILLVSLDDEINEIRELVKSDTLSWNLVVDSAGQAIRMFDLYNVKSLPQCLLVDKEGVIRLRTTNGVELKQTVDTLLD